MRTGLFGQKVVMNGGAFVVPIFHDVTPVNMRTQRIEVQRARDSAIITKDRMRVDVVADFFVRVEPEKKAVATAAQAIGRRLMDVDGLRDMVEGKFVDTLRSVAAEMTMEELHEKRGEYARRVREGVTPTLASSGLQLEAVSLTQLDQTNMEYFNPSNAFDAEGLTRLTEEIERRKKKRNDIEQDTLIAIRNKNLETEKLGARDRPGDRGRPHRPGAPGRDRARRAARAARHRAGRAGAAGPAGRDLAAGRRRALAHRAAAGHRHPAHPARDRAAAARGRAPEVARDRRADARHRRRRPVAPAVGGAGRRRARPRACHHRRGGGVHGARGRGGRAQQAGPAHRRGAGGRARLDPPPDRRQRRQAGRGRAGRGSHGCSRKATRMPRRSARWRRRSGTRSRPKGSA